MGKQREDVVHLQAVIQLDEQATNECTLLVLLQDNLFIDPILTREKREAIERKKTYIRPHYFEEYPSGFIGPVNIDYFYQRYNTFEFCDLIIQEPHSITWAEASNTTRSLWEDWHASCEQLNKEIQQLPFNYLQVAIIRELDARLDEAFNFFEKRKRLEARAAQVESRTISGKRC